METRRQTLMRICREMLESGMSVEDVAGTLSLNLRVVLEVEETITPAESMATLPKGNPGPTLPAPQPGVRYSDDDRRRARAGGYMLGTFTRLDDKTWAVWVEGSPMPGDRVLVRTKDGAEKRELVDLVITQRNTEARSLALCTLQQ